MSREITNEEAIANLNHIYGMVSPDIQRSLDVAIKALEERPQGEFDLEDFKRFVEGKIDMQDLYLPAHLFMLLDEYLDMKGGADMRTKENNNV